MAKRFYLDASALAKRYVVEIGTPIVNYLFSQVARDDMMCLALGTVEVISIFVRKKNANVVPLAVFNQAMTDFRSEVIDAPDFTKIAMPDPLLYAAMPLAETHSLNATDAVVLRSALDIAVQLRADGHDLVLVASDRRLLKAAQAEGLLTFDPEVQMTADLDALRT